MSAHPPRLAHLVQRPGVLHEAGAALDQSPLHLGRVGLAGRGAALEGGTERLRQAALVAGPVVGVEDEVGQAHPLEAREHDVQGCPLLGDEQHAPTRRHGPREQVGDGLGLARPGRALDDQVRTAAHGVDGGLLGGVGVEDEVLARGVDVSGAVRHRGAHGLQGTRVAGQRGDDVVVGEVRPLCREVGDHGQLGVGEGAHHQPRCHGEVRYLLAQPRQGGIHGVGVEAVAARRPSPRAPRCRGRVPAGAQVVLGGPG